MKVVVKRNIIYKLRLLDAGTIIDLPEDDYLRKQIDAGFIEPVSGNEGKTVETKTESAEKIHQAEDTKAHNEEATTQETSTEGEGRGETGVVCPICGKEFKTQPALKRHLRRTHKLSREEISKLLE